VTGDIKIIDDVIIFKTRDNFFNT